MFRQSTYPCNYATPLALASNRQKRFDPCHIIEYLAASQSWESINLHQKVKELGAIKDRADAKVFAVFQQRDLGLYLLVRSSSMYNFEQLSVDCF